MGINRIGKAAKWPGGKVTLEGLEDRPPITPLQARVYRFIRDFQSDHRRSPTCREIGEHLGRHHPQVALSHVHALRKKGYLVTAKFQRRMRIRLLDGESRGHVVPVVTARILGGQLEIGTQREPLIPGEIFNDATTASVRIRGMRLAEVGLKDGDFAIITRGGEVRQGRKALAVVGGKLAVVRRPKWTGTGEKAKRWEAVANCPADQAAVDDARVLGELKGLIRKS